MITNEQAIEALYEIKKFHIESNVDVSYEASEALDTLREFISQVEQKPVPERRSQNQECEWCGSIGPWGQVTSVTGISKSERDMKIKIEIGDPVTLCDTCLGIKWE